MSGRGTERLLDILEWLAMQPASVSFTDVVNSLGLPKSSTLELLRLLVQRSYVDRLSDGRYRLMRLPGEVSEGHEAWGTLLKIAEPVLREAIGQTEETGFVAVMDGFEVRYLNKLLPNREIRYDRDITRLRTPHDVASGIVLLSEVDDAVLEDYCAKHALSDDQHSQVTSKTDKARQDGYSVNLQGLVEGAGGVSAPIRNRDGQIVAAINIAGPKDRIVSEIDRIVDAVVSAAHAVSEELARCSPKSKFGDPL